MYASKKPILGIVRGPSLVEGGLRMKKPKNGSSLLGFGDELGIGTQCCV